MTIGSRVWSSTVSRWSVSSTGGVTLLVLAIAFAMLCNAACGADAQQMTIGSGTTTDDMIAKSMALAMAASAERRQAMQPRVLHALMRQLQQLVRAAPTADKRVIAEAVSPRRLFDFVTDPSLLITILHSLEVAYWTFPFGFLLMPVINFFRVPNKRNGKDLLTMMTQHQRPRSMRRRRHTDAADGADADANAALSGRLRHIQATLHRALLSQHAY